MAKTTSTLNLHISPFHHIQNRDSFGHNKIPIFFSPKPPTYTTICRTSSVAITSSSSSSIEKAKKFKTAGNADICKFCELGDLENAVDSLYKHGKSNVETRTYWKILQLCADSKSLHNGQKVHFFMCSNAVEIDDKLGSKLVFMYVKCGDLAEARRVFNEIASENVLIWNLLINEYARNGDFQESICLYRRMIELGVEGDSYTFSSIFKCFAALGSVMDLKCLHGRIVRLGFGRVSAVVNSLIACYFKCGRVHSARQLFDKMCDRDVITWNSMISGYVASAITEKGLELFKEMVISGLSVDLATMVIVLRACTEMGSLFFGRVVHAYAMKGRFANDIKFSNTLLDMYSKCGDFNASVKVFENMGERSVVSYTSMIAGYAKEGLFDKSIEIFLNMKNQGIKPDSFTITSILHVCACNNSLAIGKEIHNYITEKNLLSLPVLNALMDMYAKCGSMEDAYQLFAEMPVKDVISWNTLIGGYTKNSLPNEALRFSIEMQAYVWPDNVTMTCILPACASLGALDKGREIHSYILRNSLSSDQYVMNALVDMYVKCGSLAHARLLFDSIRRKDHISWTVMISGYGIHGFGREAIAIFEKMKNDGIELDEVSFTSILYACSHSGLVDEGFIFYNIMKGDCKIVPNLEHYACMVNLLSRAGNLADAYKFVNEMPIEPDARIWAALLSGCKVHHDVKLAEIVAENVFELEPENTGYYVLLANIYAEAEKWEEIKKLREKIVQSGSQKCPGCSWIEMKGNVYIFVAEDNSNRYVKKVKSFVQALRTKMKEEGYLPNVKKALVNSDEMDKEVAQCGHSEKLAMAFGVLNLPPGRTIRVTKNLRICGDCHEMAKFISKTLGREIVLRDSNRFHHFKDGFCSCRGSW